MATGGFAAFGRNGVIMLGGTEAGGVNVKLFRTVHRIVLIIE